MTLTIFGHTRLAVRSHFRFISSQGLLRGIGLFSLIFCINAGRATPANSPAGPAAPYAANAPAGPQQQIDALRLREHDLAAEVADLRRQADSLTDPQPKSDPIADRIARQKVVIEKAEKGLTAALAESEALRAAALKALQSNPEYQAAASDETAAEGALRTATSAALAALAARPTYRQAQKQLEMLAAEVEKSRPGPSAELSEASIAWMNALSALKSQDAEFLDHDREIVSARVELKARHAATVAVLTRLEKQTPPSPELTLADSRLDEARKMLTQAREELKAAQVEQQKAQKAAQSPQTQANARAAAARLPARERQLEQVRTELASLERR